MSGKEKTVIGLIVLAFAMIFIFKDSMDLFNKRDLKKVKADAAYEVLTVSHTLYGIIPTGKDHYYLALAEDSSDSEISGYLFRASEKWYQENFGQDHLAIPEEGVEIQALTKTMRSKYERAVQKKIQEFQHIFEDTNVSIKMRQKSDEYLEIGYLWRATLKLVTLLLIIVAIVAGVIVVKKFNRPDSIILKAYVIVVFVTTLLFIITIFVSM